MVWGTVAQKLIEIESQASVNSKQTITIPPFLIDFRVLLLEIYKKAKMYYDVARTTSALRSERCWLEFAEGKIPSS